jgi:hypothetical protein
MGLSRRSRSGRQRRLPARACSRLCAGALCAAAWWAIAPFAQAQDFTVHGYVEVRGAAGSNETSWLDGGLGKSRFGDGDGPGTGNAALAARWQLTPALSATTELQFAPQLDPSLDVIDAYLAYRPVSTTPWRWSMKLGAFFPPISQENDAVGWTSPWTLSPSAIDSWVGEELRTIGVEGRLEHRGDRATVQGFAALYRGNDPAGELLSARGWALGDLTTGLNGRLREPDAYAGRAHATVPMRYRPFDEIDGRPGWYAGMSADAPGVGTLTLLRYDNRGDPAQEEEHAGRDVYAWHTRFWSIAGRTRARDMVLIAQAMDGSTAFEPVPGLLLDTRLHAAYLLGAWERGAWTPALRLDLFALRQLPEMLAQPLSEHGNALTVALNWRPRERVRVTGEWLRIDSHRDQRVAAGLASHQIDQQLQLSLRLSF